MGDMLKTTFSCYPYITWDDDTCIFALNALVHRGRYKSVMHGSPDLSPDLGSGVGRYSNYGKLELKNEC